MIVTISRTIDNWLTELDSDYLVGDKVTAADLAAYQQLKQICTFAEVGVDQEEFP
eukprot:CAMPEP_0170469698 /NCGR_PEP_ID=MMETSP0123-20130129/12446_1 /TAXON_ID=182087 /ORGANISM="Favella ehrenbergii, Strain Fehren 1" /LENGTH=54 /DNA_ID=CAMNT_0010736663 /DNA_START=560 /DNA_END=724 /DNA_ORIENTATION=-